MKAVVLDASALLTYLEEQPGESKMRALLHLAFQGERELLMSVINWGEVCYAAARSHGADIGQRIEARIAQLPVKIVDADRPVTRLAAEFHVRHKLPYVDCFAAALARQNGARLATRDRDFARVVSEIPLIWV